MKRSWLKELVAYGVERMGVQCLVASDQVQLNTYRFSPVPSAICYQLFIITLVPYAISYRPIAARGIQRDMVGCRLLVILATIIVGVMTLMADVAVAQYGGGRGMGGQMDAPAPPPGKSTAGSETNWIPSISLQERYDSNVYFISGQGLEDYVTTIAPKVRVVHKGSLIDATVGGGARGEVYAKNPGLNYVAGNGLVNLDLSRATNELVRGLGLRVSDSFRYTPELPAFAAPAEGSEVPESAILGIQARRANSYSNAGQANVFYEISPILGLTSSYMDRRIRFGKVLSPLDGQPSPGALIDTTFQTVTSGPVLKVSPVDTLTLSHQYQKGTFGGQGIGQGFSTQGVMAGWTRLLTPTLTASVTGGVSVLDRSNSNNLQYVGSASLVWNGENTDLMLSYSRAIAPSFYVAATALMNQIIKATASHRVTESLSLSISASYAHSESVPDSNVLQFDSYAMTPSAQYRINRIMTANLSYTHSLFDRKYFGEGYNFDRDMVLLRLAAEWN